MSGLGCRDLPRSPPLATVEADSGGQGCHGPARRIVLEHPVDGRICRIAGHFPRVALFRRLDAVVGYASVATILPL